MYHNHNGRLPDEPEEVMVYDWNNAMSVPSGTTRLLNLPSNTVPNSRPMSPPLINYNASLGRGIIRYGNPSNFLNHANQSTNYAHQYNQNQSSFGYGSPYACPPQQGFYAHNPNHWSYNSGYTSTQYYGQSDAAYFGESSRLARHDTPPKEDDWLDVEEIDYSQRYGQRHVHATNARTKKHVPPPSPPSSLPRTSDYSMEFEEIDYSDLTNRGAETARQVPSQSPQSPCDDPSEPNSPVLQFEETGKSKTKYKVAPSSAKKNMHMNPSPAKTVIENTKDSNSSKLTVPKPDLPLSEVLSVLPNKPKAAARPEIRYGRKRPRNELEKSDSSDLEDLLCKTKHRVSARSYAKPTRKADASSTSSNTRSTDEKQPQGAPVLNGNDNHSAHNVITPQIEENGLNDMDGVTSESLMEDSAEALNDSAVDFTNSKNDSESDEAEGVGLKIRTDIFEEEEEEADDNE